MGLSKMGFCTFLVVVMLMINIEKGVMGFKEVKVGGSHEWNVPSNNDPDFFKRWAGERRLHAGDSLLFVYKNDSVVAVDKYGYYHCDLSKATSTFNDGNTRIKIEHPGQLYFISGSVDHCNAGLRVAFDVMSHHSHHPAAAPSQGPAISEAPAPSPAHAKSSGSQLVPIFQVSSLVGLVALLYAIFV